MGLNFLNKKPFHTGSFQNIQKVWIAEQKEAERLRKVAERLKKLQEEKHQEHLKSIQIEKGILPNSRKERLDWMYEGNAIKSTSSEEYLLGKQILDQEFGEDKAYKKEPRPFFSDVKYNCDTNSANEAFSKLYEDPLYVIKQHEIKKRIQAAKDQQSQKLYESAIQKYDYKQKSSPHRNSSHQENEHEQKKMSYRNERSENSKSDSRNQRDNRSRSRNSERDREQQHSNSSHYEKYNQRKEKYHSSEKEEKHRNSRK